MAFKRCDDCSFQTTKFHARKHCEWCTRPIIIKGGKAQQGRMCSAERDNVLEPQRVEPKCGPEGRYWVQKP